MFLFTTLLTVVAVAAAQSTTTAGTHGQSVVDAAIGQIHGAGIWADDHQFLRRIAWVESKFGDDPNTYRAGYNGGIWQIDQTWFQNTQNTAAHPGLKTQYQKVKAALGIDWPSVSWLDCREPLYSVLAARLGLATRPESIPSTVDTQAAYWKKIYNSAAGAGSEQKFKDDVKALEG